MGERRGLVHVLVAVLLVLVISFFIVSVNYSSKLTGKAIVTEREEVNPVGEQKVDSVCSGSECNPSNVMQICSDGNWVGCGNDEVCSLGACVVPKKVEFNNVYSGGGGGGGVNTGIIVGPAPTEPVVSRSIGEVSESIEEIGKNEKIIFNINGSEQSLTGLDVSATSLTMRFNDRIDFVLRVDDKKLFDINADGQNDWSVKVKSINIINNKATIVISLI